MYSCSLFLRSNRTVCKLNLWLLAICFWTIKVRFLHKFDCKTFCKKSPVNFNDQLLGIMSISFGISKLGNSLLFKSSNVGFKSRSFSLK